MDTKKHCPFCGEEILLVAIKCKHCSGMLDSAQSQTSHESILADVAANLFLGIEWVGGRLQITNIRLAFKAHVLNLQKILLEVSHADIASVAPRNTLGIVPNGMVVTTKSGVEYRFVVNGRDRLMALINEHISHPA